MNTHECWFKEVLGRENLIGGVESSTTILDLTLLNLEHAVHTRQQHHKDGPCHTLHHEGSSTSLQPIQSHDHKLPQWGLEQQHRYHRCLHEHHKEQQLNHLRNTNNNNNNKGMNRRFKGLNSDLWLMGWWQFTTVGWQRHNPYGPTGRLCITVINLKMTTRESKKLKKEKKMGDLIWEEKKKEEWECNRKRNNNWKAQRKIGLPLLFVCCVFKNVWCFLNISPRNLLFLSPTLSLF